MPDVPIKTNKTKEAIYEYSTSSRVKDLSLDANFIVELFYNGGTRQLRIKEGRKTTTIPLITPKKPDYTPPLRKLKQSTKKR